MGIAVIGGGIYGSTIAYFLKRFGDDEVLLFEKGDLGGVSTSRSAGIIRHHYSHKNHIRIVKRSREIIENLDEYIGRDGGFKQNGYLAVAGPDNERAFRDIVELQHEVGLDVDLLEPAELQDYLPAISPEELAVGAIEHEAGFADPYQVAVGFANGAQDLGAKIHPKTEVTDILTNGQTVTAVETEDEHYEVDYVVNAAGAFGAEIADMVGVSIPIEWHGALVAVLDASEPYGPDLPTVSDMDAGLYTKPEMGGEFVTGGFDHNPVDHPRNGAGRVSNSQLLNLFDLIEERLPGYADAEVVNTWTGLITDTPDAQQLIGRVQQLDNFYVAIGGNGHGFKEAPGFAESIAQDILGLNQENNLHPYRLSRFEENDEFVGRYDADWLG